MADVRAPGLIGRYLYLAVASALFAEVTVSDLRNRVDLTSSRGKQTGRGVAAPDEGQELDPTPQRRAPLPATIYNT